MPGSQALITQVSLKTPCRHDAMANSHIPTITKRAPTIDFIDQRLPKYHPFFASQAVQYDPGSRKFVERNMRNNVVSTGTPAAPASSASLIQRREWRQINALTFWAGIFPESMAQFNSTQESYSRSKSMYDIRDKTDWHSVYETLELARKNRDSDGGSLRKAHRRKIDRVKPGANAAKLESKVTSQESLATPVLDAVEVILDAVKSTNGVRNQVLADFDGLIPVFADVELFISTFPSDANIRNASIDLTVATLVAIDRAICVFISNESARTGTY